LEVCVEVPGPNALKVHEMLAELRLQLVFGGVAVDQIGPLPSDRPAEHFGIRIDRRRIGFLRAAATNNAVDPTLVLMSQVSLSVRTYAVIRRRTDSRQTRRHGREMWNVNIHYDGKLDDCVPRSATSALDVGCGDGLLANRLAARVPRVVAIDVDRPVLERAKQRVPDAPVIWRNADVLAAGEELGSFDAVVSNATLHHLPDTREGLRRMRERVRPGGTLAIVSFARPG
jgi:SAM-dependent methyltransferase